MKIGSWANSGSEGKNIWVISRCVNARPNSEKWMCWARHALGWFCHGYAPGLMVTKRYRPSESVMHRPAPVKLGSSGAGCRSAPCR